MRIPRPSPPISFTGDHRSDVRVQYYATLYGADSYANVAHAFGHALADRMDSVGVCNYVGGEIDDPVLNKHAGLNRHAHVGVFFGLPTHVPDDYFEHVVRIGIFVCETDQILPNWVRLCNRLHLVVVPSRYVRRSFVESGVKVPIMVVPHGVHPQHRPLEGQRPDDRFVFYNSFRFQAADRKGYEELLRCFQRAFQGRDDVVLRLRSGDRSWLPRYPGWPDYGGLVQFDEPDTLTMEEAAAVYSQVHCTVHPSKGEGFGLIPLESMACETPVVTPAHSGMADYVGEENAILMRTGDPIRARRTEIQCGRWRGVDEESLVERLRHAREHWASEREKLAVVAPEIRRRYAWPEVLKPFVDIVDAALGCEDSWEFSQYTGEFRDADEIQRAHDEAERRARAAAPPPEHETSGGTFRFSSIVYSGWDYPRDGVGNHLRLLDGLIFDDPAIRYKSLEELPASYDPELYGELRSYVHEQRPDLFRNGLHLDVVGFHGDQSVIRRQIERVTEFKERFDCRTAIYLMWESDRLWAPVLELVNAYDLTIVTSTLLEEYFQSRSVNYTVLRHPYRYTIDPPRKHDFREPLTMGISAGLWPRKNLALVAEVFAQTLGNRPDIRLEVHTRTEPLDTQAARENERIEHVVSDVENVSYRVCSFTREEYLAWMKSLDVYCFLSSGEGWSVTPREALHLGKPVVLLDAHVHADFSHLPGVIPVAPGPAQPARPGGRFIDAGIGNEAGVDTEAFGKILVSLPELCREAKNDLVSGFEQIVAYHGIETTKKQWITALNNLFD